MNFKNQISTPCVSIPKATDQVRSLLVVDDSESILQIVSRALRGAGFKVKVASDGEQAWEELCREFYDLLITDHEMPGLTGIKLIERMREAGVDLPVIITSGSLPVEQMGRYPQLQIAAFLPKPFSIPELLDSVRTILELNWVENGQNRSPRAARSIVRRTSG